MAGRSSDQKLNWGIVPLLETSHIAAIGEAPPLLDYGRREGVDFVVVGPEVPLALGLADALRAAGIPVYGPGADGARLEARDVKSVAKWPSRSEQLSILSGQISSLGSMLSGQILSAGGVLAGQISSRIEDLEKAEPAA